MLFKREKIRLRKGAMRQKLIKYMIIMEFLPLLLLTVILCWQLVNYNMNKYLSDVRNTLKKESYNINLSLQLEKERCNVIVKNDVLFVNLNYDFNRNLDMRLRFSQQLRTVLNTIENMKYGSDVEYLFYTNNPDVLIDESIKPLQELETQEIYDNIKKAKDLENVWDIRQEEDGSSVIVIYQKFSKISDYFNVLECTIPFDSHIGNRLKEAGETGIIYIYCDEQAIAAYSSLQDIKIGTPFHMEEHPNLYLFEEKLISGHKLIAAVPQNVWWDVAGEIIIAALALFLILFVLLCVNIFMISGKVTDDLEDFTRKIADNPLNYLDCYQTAQYEAQEVNQIEKKFLKVLTELNKLHKEKLEQEKYNNSLELEILQAKINPHLLYNTLSALKWQMLEREEYKEADLVDYMVKYYRLVLNKGSNIVELKQELEMIQIYLNLVMNVKNMQIELEMDVSGELMAVLIPKQLLQPFVENSVLHGFGVCESKKKVIRIRAHKEDEHIVIGIEDNGMGIKEEIARQLENGTYRCEYGGYGVVNVINRMKACYGEDYEVRIEALSEGGTCVRVKYPLITQKK